jgi:hypothetical protein
MFDPSWPPFVFVEGSCFVNAICIYLHTRVSNTISISDDVSDACVTSGAGTAIPSGMPEFTPPPISLRFAFLDHWYLCNIL